MSGCSVGENLTVHTVVPLAGIRYMSDLEPQETELWTWNLISFFFFLQELNTECFLCHNKKIPNLCDYYVNCSLSFCCEYKAS